MNERTGETGVGRSWRFAPAGWRLHLPLVLILLAMLWSLAGYVVVPWLVKRNAPTIAHEQAGIELSLGDVRMDPWRLSVEVIDLAASDPTYGPLLDIQRGYANLELASLWKTALVLSEVEVEQPRVNLVRLEDGNLNLVQAIETPPPEDPPPKDQPPPDFLIQRLVLSAGRVDITDRTVPGGYETHLGPVSLALTDFGTTSRTGGRNAFEARLEYGGVANWEGTLTLAPVTSKGRFELRNSSVAVAWRYVRHDVNFAPSDGRWHTAFDYDFELTSAGPRLEVNDIRFGIADLALAAKGAEEPALVVPELSLAGGAFRLADQDLRIEEIKASGLRASVRRAANGTVNLAEMFAPAGDGEGSGAEAPSPENGTAPPPAEAAEDSARPGEESRSEAPFTASLQRFLLEDAVVEFDDEAAPEPVRLVASDVDLMVSDYRSEGGHRADFELSVTMESGGAIGLEGELQGVPMTVATGLEIEGLDLVPMAPYLADVLNLDFESMAASAGGKVRIDPEQPFAFNGAATISGMAARFPQVEEKLVAWQDLELHELDVDLAAQTARVGRVLLDGAFLEVLVDEQGNLNLARIAPDDSTPEGEPASDEASGDQQQPFGFVVGQVSVEQAEVNFTDLNLPLPFTARIQPLGGSVSAITSLSPAPARMVLEGDVNEYGSARVDGRLDFFDPTRLADIKIVFRNVSMPNFSPYTVKFAGRRIADGRIDLTLDWVIDNGQLQADNHMVITDLELGEKVPTEGAMNLPLGLAIALLTDSEGRIDLEVPVTGDLDDPKFSYSGLIFKALGNILTKIVTAPFRALGALLGVGDGGEQALEFVAFEPAATKLAGPERQELDQLAEALARRPALALEIPAVFNRELDAPAMREAKLEAIISERFDARDGGEAGGDPLRGILETLYGESKSADALEAVRLLYTMPPEDAPPGTEAALDEAAYLEHLRAELEQAQTITDEELAALARERATSVQQHLADSAAIDPSRMGLGEVVEAEPSEEGTVRMKLGLTTAGGPSPDDDATPAETVPPEPADPDNNAADENATDVPDVAAGDT